MTTLDELRAAAATQAGVAAAPGDERVGAASRLVDEVVVLLRLVHVLKAQVASRSAHSLLFPLSAAVEPVRLTALAELVRADPSTVSRQVAELVREDLVRREPDPDDRRACRLVVTDAGTAAVARLRTQQARSLAEALQDWSTSDIAAFTASFRRLTDGLADSLGGRAAATTDPLPEDAL